MDIESIKKEFPIFDNKVHNNDLVYLDSANSSQKPRVVIDRIYDFYSKEFSNVGRSVHYLAVAATNLYENTRISVQKYINAKDKNECPSAEMCRMEKPTTRTRATSRFKAPERQHQSDQRASHSEPRRQPPAFETTAWAPRARHNRTCPKRRCAIQCRSTTRIIIRSSPRAS